MKNNQNFVSVIKKEKHFKIITNSDIIHLIKYFKLNSFDDNNEIEEFIPIYHLKQNINFNFDKFQISGLKTAAKIQHFNSLKTN